MARIISPFLGGLLAVRDLRLPYLVSAIMALTSCVLTKLICPETLPESKRKPLSIKAANPISFIGVHRNQSSASAHKTTRLLRLSASVRLTWAWQTCAQSSSGAAAAVSPTSP